MLFDYDIKKSLKIIAKLGKEQQKKAEKNKEK